MSTLDQLSAVAAEGAEEVSTAAAEWLEDNLLMSCRKQMSAQGAANLPRTACVRSGLVRLVLFDQIPHLVCQLIIQRVLLSFIQVGVVSLDKPTEIWQVWRMTRRQAATSLQWHSKVNDKRESQGGHTGADKLAAQGMSTAM